MLVFLALGNAKELSFALANAKLPDASIFASQWNIGLRCVVWHFQFHNKIFAIVIHVRLFTEQKSNNYISFTL